MAVTIDVTRRVISIDPVTKVIQVSFGEPNTAANVGGGTGNIFRDKVGTVLNFKTLTGSGDITITDNANTVDINVAAATMLPVNDSVSLVQDPVDNTSNAFFVVHDEHLNLFLRVRRRYRRNPRTSETQHRWDQVRVTQLLIFQAISSNF